MLLAINYAIADRYSDFTEYYVDLPEKKCVIIDMAVCHIVWEVYIDERTIIAYFNSKKGVHFLNINTLIVFCDPTFENINNLRNYHW